MIDLKVIVKLVNQYSDHSHVVATSSNLKFFEAPYINECLRRGLASGRMSNLEIETAKRWLEPSWEPPKRPAKVLKHW